MRALGGVDDSLKEQLVTDYKTAELSELDKAILEYAVKLTLTPAAISEKDVKDFHRAHPILSDHMLHDIVQVASYFNYVNRLADGLGVELEEKNKK